MPEVAVYAPGTPMWVDLSSTDVEASKKFYGELFGWNAETVPDPEAGGYTMFTLNGKNVAGVGPSQNPNQPPAWVTYIATDNADNTATAVTNAGGTVVMPPMDVMNAGRMAMFIDTNGAIIGVWQPKEHQGSEVVNQPNTFCWSELLTRDMNAATNFYPAVFGWNPETSPMGDMAYTEWKLNGKSIGGAMEMPAQVPSDVPPFWMTYFAVEDCDAAVAKAQQLGATVMMPAKDIPPGRFATLQDPQGATFSVIWMNGQNGSM